MTNEFDSGLLAQLAGLPEVTRAAQEGAQLIGLWPLTDATQLDNDTKYGENLQVRITQCLARVMTGLDVTIPDAEFVYEGADEIPGRPQEIVEALLAANDAYEGMAGFSRTADFGQVSAAAASLEAGWSLEQTQAAQQVVERGIAVICPEESVEASTEADTIAQRLSGSILLAYRLGQAVGAGEGDCRRALPIVLVFNEINERLEIPRGYVSDDQLAQLLQVCGQAADEQAVLDLSSALAPLLTTEWEQHRTDVLWDPDEAQRLAKEEDERKSREALQAKFAHIPEDPNKKPVEL